MEDVHYREKDREMDGVRRGEKGKLTMKGLQNEGGNRGLRELEGQWQEEELNTNKIRYWVSDKYSVHLHLSMYHSILLIRCCFMAQF